MALDRNSQSSSWRANASGSFSRSVRRKSQLATMALAPLEWDRDRVAARGAWYERRALRHASALGNEHEGDHHAQRADEQQGQAPRRHESRSHRSREYTVHTP